MITKRLRAFCAQVFCANETRAIELRAIANDIDREYESACAEAYGNGVESVELPYMANYVKLPLDADRTPVRVKDMMVDEFGHVFKVDGYKWYGDRWWIFQDTSIQAPAEHCTHWHPPTVESLLKEFGEEWDCLFDYERDVLVAEYAEKLKLASDGE